MSGTQNKVFFIIPKKIYKLEKRIINRDCYFAAPPFFLQSFNLHQKPATIMAPYLYSDRA